MPTGKAPTFVTTTDMVKARLSCGKRDKESGESRDGQCESGRSVAEAAYLEILPHTSASSIVSSLLIAFGVAEAFVHSFADQDILQSSEAREMTSVRARCKQIRMGNAADPKITPAVNRQKVTAEATCRSRTALEGERGSADMVARVQ